jgi:hypothetical protein
MKLPVKLAIAAALALSGLLIYANTLPSEYLISRELNIKATPEALFPYLNNSEKSNEWMPWKEKDPAVQMSYSGPAEGVGSESKWESTGEMGVGSARIVESQANEFVKTDLNYVKPMEMHQVATMSLAPASDGTLVRWEVKGSNGFVFKVISVFVNFEKIVGAQFEQGLTKLKKMVEKPSQN